MSMPPQPTPSASHLARRAVRGVLAVAVANAAVSLVAFAAGLYLMEKVSPVAFGIVKYAAALLAIFDSCANWGFSHGAVNRQERVDETFSAFLVLRLTMTLGVLALAAALAAGGVFTGEARLDVMGFLSIPVLVGAAGDVWATRLRRSMHFGRLSAAETVSAVGAAAVGVAMAAAGCGVWALVANRVAREVLRAAGLWLLSVERTPLRIERADAAWLLRFGLPLWLGGLATTWVLEYDSLVVGRLWGATVLGYYARACALVMMPISLVPTVLTRVSMPLYARLAAERPRLSEAFRIVAGTLLRVLAPMLAGMAVAVTDFLAVMRWWWWAPILPIFYSLLGYALVRPLMDDAGGLLAAVGRPKLAGHTLVGQAIVLLVLCPALTGWLGAPGAALSIGLVWLGGLALWYTRYLPRLLDAPYGRILLPPLLSAAVAAPVAWAAAGWARLDVGLADGLLKLSVLSVVYAAALLALDGRRTAADLRTLWRHGFGE
jgi:PST family polysaccharide transporter